MPPELIPNPIGVVNWRDWGPDFIDRFLAREWDGRFTKMVLPGIGAFMAGTVANNAYVRVNILTAGTGTFTLPVGWNPGSSEVHGIGGGGDAGAPSGPAATTGGGGGQHGQTPYSAVAGTVVNYQVGAHNSFNSTGTASAPGTSDTWWDAAATVLYAQAGTCGAVSGFGSGVGGHATAVGSSTVHNGGDAGIFVGIPGPGGSSGTAGGGAGGPNGAGQKGGDASGGGSANLAGPGGGAANGGSPGADNPSSGVGGQGGANRNGVPGGTPGATLHQAGSAGSQGSGGGGGGEAADGGDGSMDDVFDGAGPGSGGGAGGNSFFNSPVTKGGNGGGYGGGAGGDGSNTPTARALGTGGMLSIKWVP